MDQDARNQYLRDLREEYALVPKRIKTELLTEAEKRTALSSKVISRKPAHPTRRRPVPAAFGFDWHPGFNAF